MLRPNHHRYFVSYYTRRAGGEWQHNTASVQAKRVRRRRGKVTVKMPKHGLLADLSIQRLGVE